MATEVLDILDTAVKIGLGASIAGITSYVLVARNHRYEKVKAIHESNNNMLKEIALDFEKASVGTNRIVIDINIFFSSGKEFDQEIYAKISDSLMDSASHLEKVNARSNLLGYQNISSCCEAYLDCLNAVSYTHLTLPTIYSV